MNKTVDEILDEHDEIMKILNAQIESIHELLKEVHE